MDQGFSGFGGRGDKFGPSFIIVILNRRQEFKLLRHKIN